MLIQNRFLSHLFGRDAASRGSALSRTPLGDGYDIVVVGGGVRACAIALACARDGAAVALLAPADIAGSAAERAWPVVRSAHPDPWRTAIQADAPRRSAALARRLAPSPHAERDGCLSIAADRDAIPRLSAARDHAVKAGVDAWMVPALEIAALSPPLAGGEGRAAALYEPHALTLDADALAFALAVAAAEAGAAVHWACPVSALARDGGRAIGVEVAGRFVRAGAVALADDEAAIRLVREGKGRLSLKREERVALVTARAPALGPAAIADDLTLARDQAGALILSGPVGAHALAARLLALAPAFADLKVVAEEPATIWSGVDGRAQIGPADIAGLWLALGFGRDALSPALGVADHLAAALGGGRPDPAFEPFAPTRRPQARTMEASR